MALFKDTPDLKNYVAIDVNTDFATIKPYIEQAEDLFIKDLLGAFYAEFNTAYQAFLADPTGSPLSADNLALLPYIQKSLAYYAIFKFTPFMDLSFGDMGMQQNTNLQSLPAPQWKVERFEYDSILNADLFADKLLEFLEANADGTTHYASWFNDPTANTRLTGAIVRNAAIAGKYIQINNSRRVFLKLKAKITQIESRYVPKMVGDAQYDLLVAHIAAGTLTDDEKNLVALLEPIISKMALEKSLPSMDVTISKDGITIFSFNNSIVERLKPDAKQLEALKCSLRELEEFGYEADEQALIQFINDNITLYPLIAATGVYTAQPTDGPVYKPDNDPENNFFAV